MREAWAAILLVTTAVLAGCIGGEVPEDGERIEATAFGLESALDTVREGTTLAQAPQWAIGEWWTYSFEQVPSGTEETFTIVVAGAEPGNYLVGLPAGEVPIMPFIFHLPGVGQVRMTDLAYEAHDEPFELLKFPLEEGVSWDGVYWASAPMTVSVDRVEGSTAELTLASGDQEHALTYDAEVGYLTHYRIPAQGELEVELELVDHGFGYEGDVMVPYEQDLTMCHGQGLFVMGIEGCQASPGGTPMDTFEIPDGYTAATFALVLESGQAEGEHLPGAASIEVTDPHGNVYEAGARGTYMVVQGHHLEEPAGTWSHDVAQAGAGFAIVEGVTYTKVEVSLPSGCMLGAVPDGLAGTPCA